MRLQLPQGKIRFEMIVGGDHYRYKCDTCTSYYQSTSEPLDDRCLSCNWEERGGMWNPTMGRWFLIAIAKDGRIYYQRLA